VDGRADAVDTAIGRLPTPDALDTTGLSIDAADLDEILRVDTDGWSAAIDEIREHFARFGDRLPAELDAQVDRLASALSAS